MTADPEFNPNHGGGERVGTVLFPNGSLFASSVGWLLAAAAVEVVGQRYAERVAS